ncbi:hypothetical protein [Streptomyces nitrosporeus]|uniref:hypothetical protein n=1 Tax=Streptomyces nitrosporeus TaxID=28894 RepID=UPI0039A3D978
MRKYEKQLSSNHRSVQGWGWSMTWPTLAARFTGVPAWRDFSMMPSAGVAMYQVTGLRAMGASVKG